jgi:hypothetical protein
MSKIQPGSLVMLLPCPQPEANKHAGEVHVVGDRSPGPGPNKIYWKMDPPVVTSDGRFIAWEEAHLRLIDNPPDDAVDETLVGLKLDFEIKS